MVPLTFCLSNYNWLLVMVYGKGIHEWSTSILNILMLTNTDTHFEEKRNTFNVGNK